MCIAGLLVVYAFTAVRIFTSSVGHACSADTSSSCGSGGARSPSSVCADLHEWHMHAQERGGASVRVCVLVRRRLWDNHQEHSAPALSCITQMLPLHSYWGLEQWPCDCSAYESHMVWLARELLRSCTRGRPAFDGAAARAAVTEITPALAADLLSLSLSLAFIHGQRSLQRAAPQRQLPCDAMARLVQPVWPTLVKPPCHELQLLVHTCCVLTLVAAAAAAVPQVQATHLPGQQVQQLYCHGVPVLLSGKHLCARAHAAAVPTLIVLPLLLQQHLSPCAAAHHLRRADGAPQRHTQALLHPTRCRRCETGAGSM